MRACAWLLAASLAGCGGVLAPVDTAQLPAGEFAGADPDLAAVDYAAAAFASQSTTYGDPAAGAEAALAMEYVAGALNTSPRWTSVDDGTKAQLLQGRDALRAALGIAAGAPSQAVVDALASARRALQAGNQAGALAAVQVPAFTMPPDKTIEALGNLPYLQPANASTLRASEEASGIEGSPAMTHGDFPL